jgi:O-acetyl-ADP-ribose deacetylase (regulator of RNase III)
MEKNSASIRLPNRHSIEILQGDLTEQKVDAIVNAANSQLMHGGGVAAAIVRRGGPIIQTESDAWVNKYGLVTHANPAHTQGGDLPCKVVIHAVGPMWGSGDEEAKLSTAISSSMKLAEQLGLTSIALPPISTGIFGFPKEKAARVIIQTIQEFFLNKPGSPLSLVRLVIIDTLTFNIFLAEFQKTFIKQ